MLRPEKVQAHKRAQIVQSLALQGVLAVVIVIAALFSRGDGLVFWLTLSLLAIPISISAVYVRALMQMDAQRKRG